MNSESRHLAEDSVSPESKGPAITATFSDYSPPFAVVPIVERMVGSVPKKYLVGLSEVVLTNTSGMPRKVRRGMTRSRKKKVRMITARGLYHPAWQGNPAWIEIFVDNTLRGWDKGLWLIVPFIREIMLSDVLFHEIGHHIHFTSRPEYKEREDVADTWKARLQRNYDRSRHLWFRAITSPFRPLIRALMKPMYRIMLRRRMISRAEFDELTKPTPNTL